MIYNLLTFLAPETAISLNQAQASTPKPPATHWPVPGLLSRTVARFKLVFSVLANALGFSIFLAAFWMGLYLVYTLIQS